MSKYTRYYSKYRKLIYSASAGKKSIPRRRNSIRKARRTQRLTALSVIFVIGLIMLILIVKAAAMFSVRISIKDVAAFKIPPKEIEYIYEICKEEDKDPTTVLTAYCIYNRFFKEKRVAHSKEQIQTGFMPKLEKVKSSVSEKRFGMYKSVVESVFSDIKVFPVDISESYIFGDTWSTKSNSCEGRRHTGMDIFDRENIGGRVPVMSMTGGTIETKGKNGDKWYVGVRTEKGAYYYYDHLDRLEGAETGAPVAAGAVLGYMGTNGNKHPAKVHIGIKLNTELKNNAIWINPYPFLRFYEAKDSHYSDLSLID